MAPLPLKIIKTAQKLKYFFVCILNYQSTSNMTTESFDKLVLDEIYVVSFSNERLKDETMKIKIIPEDRVIIREYLFYRMVVLNNDTFEPKFKGEICMNHLQKVIIFDDVQKVNKMLFKSVYLKSCKVDRFLQDDCMRAMKNGAAAATEDDEL